jgi:hypothetical protein
MGKKLWMFVSLIMALVIAVSVFLFFKGFSDAKLQGYSSEIYSALLGSIFTAFIMIVMLNVQSKAEELKERNVEVFKLKVSMYKSFINFILKITSDGKISDAEMTALENWFYRLSLVANKTTLFRISDFIAQIKMFPVLNYKDMDDSMRKKYNELGWKEDNYITWQDIICEMRNDVGIGGYITNSEELLKEFYS